jgi:ferrochelatase
MNLGGPSQEADIRPFLYNFFMDKNIIGAPLPIRWFIAHYISRTRSKAAARAAYEKLGFKSPLLENTRKQAEALQTELRGRGMDAEVLVSMRYWYPLSKEVIGKLNDLKPDHLVLLPLYPQFSTTTTGSSFQDFWTNVQADDGALHARWGDETNVSKICCYPVQDGFIKASAENIRQQLEKAPGGTRLLFSAHGLPEKIVIGGDPYQYQCEKTAEAIVRELNIPGLDWQICYQSRVGPLKWIGPSTEEALAQAAADRKGVVIYPHAFVSEHVETLVEIEMEYRHKAEQLGLPYFARVETVGTHPAFIAGLAKLVKDAISGKPCGRSCPEKFKRCACEG